MSKFETLREAVRELYYAAHWSADRPCDSKRLWEQVRDAAGFEQSEAPKPFQSEQFNTVEQAKQNVRKRTIPHTLNEAIEQIVSEMRAEDVKHVLKHGLVGQHFGTGMAIRNEWKLWYPKESPLARFFIDNYGIGHADDMSGMILKGVEAYVKGQTFDADAQAEYYRQYWTKKGIDPKTQEKL